MKRRLANAAIVLTLALGPGAHAQVPTPLAPQPVPQFNPSSPLLIPQQNEVPVSPTAPGGSSSAIGGSVSGGGSIISEPRAVHHHHKRHYPAHHALRRRS